tara:strand:+ start:126 stop:443 length:318 start_codon:yes stop_codon:yes gene_type:complete
MKRLFTYLLLSLLFKSCDSYLIPPINPTDALKIVEFSSQILPNFDTVGHYVLNLNEQLITNVIHSNLNYDIKKSLILKIIELTQQGDEIGGIILKNYYNFVNNIL